MSAGPMVDATEDGVCEVNPNLLDSRGLLDATGIGDGARLPFMAGPYKHLHRYTAEKTRESVPPSRWQPSWRWTGHGERLKGVLCEKRGCQ